MTMANIAISTNDLLITYPLSGRHFALTQLTSITILDQVYLDSAAIGSEFAELIQFYQYQMNMTSIKYSNDVLSRYIKLISNGGNYSKLIQAYIGLEAPNIPLSVNNAELKKSLLEVTQALVDASDEIAFVIKLLKNEMELIKITFQEIQSKYDTTLSNLIKSSGVKVEDLNKKIEAKNKEINDNIEAIIKGGEDLAKGLNDLGNGTLTTIANIPSEKKEKEEKKRLVNKESKPDPNYAIEAITLSAAGIAKGSSATKALAINNKELAALYQEMSNFKAIYSVAISTQIQNNLMIDNFEKCAADSLVIEGNWSEVADSCTKLKTNIDNLKTESEAQALAKSVSTSLREWTELDSQLAKLKTAFTGG
jgi:hypothetical protein